MLIGMLATMGSAIAEVPDPTRPPAAAAADLPAGEAAAAPPSGVQAVFMRQGAKPAALINGQYVVQGGWLGERRLVSVTESGVVLRDKDGKNETLSVIVGVEKQPAGQRQASPATAEGAGKK
jgi:hypothetical protein